MRGRAEQEVNQDHMEEIKQCKAIILLRRRMLDSKTMLLERTSLPAHRQLTLTNLEK